MVPSPDQIGPHLARWVGHDGQVLSSAIYRSATALPFVRGSG